MSKYRYTILTQKLGCVQRAFYRSCLWLNLWFLRRWVPNLQCTRPQSSYFSLKMSNFEKFPNLQGKSRYTEQNLRHFPKRKVGQDRKMRNMTFSKKNRKIKAWYIVDYVLIFGEIINLVINMNGKMPFERTQAFGPSIFRRSLSKL